MEKQYSFNKAYKMCDKKGLSFVRVNSHGDYSILTGKPPRLICPHPNDMNAKDWFIADVKIETMDYSKAMDCDVMPSYEELKNALVVLAVFVNETTSLEHDKLVDSLMTLEKAIQENKNVLKNKYRMRSVI